MNEVSGANHERSLKAVIAEVREEVKDFISIRLRMAKAELQETFRGAKVAAPLSLVALAFISTGFLMLTLAAVAVIAAAFAGRPYAWFYAFAIVGILMWCIGGATAGFFAYNAIRRGWFPKRTVEVLKADTLWIQSETRSQW
jgi:hypothetical protein